MTTGFEVRGDVLLDAALRCRRTVEEVRDAARATGALEPSLGHAQVDAAARRLLRDLEAVLVSLGDDLQQDADGLELAARGYAVTEALVVRERAD